jgi:L-threonylcarbamoyladenylate synthase
MSDSTATALAALKRGEVIVFPTETLYGLGAPALSETAVETVFRLKGRDPKIPIPVLVSDRAMLDRLVDAIPPMADQLIQRFWPGPLTLVLPGRGNLPRPLLNPSGGIAVRISSHALATELVRLLGEPLTATSANPSGAEPARTLAQARNYFKGKVDVFIDGGTLGSKNGSTVVEVQERGVSIIREGDIATAALAEVLGAALILRTSGK